MIVASDEHRKLALDWLIKWYSDEQALAIKHAEPLAQMLAAFECTVRLEEAKRAALRAHYLMDVHSPRDCEFCQRIAELERAAGDQPRKVVE